MPCRSEPELGSVNPTAPTSSPQAMRGSQRCLCSFAAAGEDVVSHNALDAEAEVDAASGELLDDDRLVGKSPAPAPIFLGYVREQQSDLARLDPSLGVRVTLLSPTRVLGRKLHFDKLANRLLKDPRLVSRPGRFVCHFSVSKYSRGQLSFRRSRTNHKGTLQRNL